jgi:hypothetical protein
MLQALRAGRVTPNSIEQIIFRDQLVRIARQQEQDARNALGSTASTSPSFRIPNSRSLISISAKLKTLMFRHEHISPVQGMISDPS